MHLISAANKGPEKKGCSERNEKKRGEKLGLTLATELNELKKAKESKERERSA